MNDGLDDLFLQIKIPGEEITEPSNNAEVVTGKPKILSSNFLIVSEFFVF